jgi:hypothetical protein
VGESASESFSLCFVGFDGFGISFFGGITLGKVHIVRDSEGEMEVGEGQVGCRHSGDKPCGAVDVETECGA